jgi:hypothetical protein
LVASEDSQILNLVSARTTAVCTVIAYEGSIAEQKEVRIGVEQGAAGIASKAIQVPSIARYKFVSSIELGYWHIHDSSVRRSTATELEVEDSWHCHGANTKITNHIPSSNAFPSSRICE